jgi:hypothetical protein
MATHRLRIHLSRQAWQGDTPGRYRLVASS